MATKVYKTGEGIILQLPEEVAREYNEFVRKGFPYRNGIPGAWAQVELAKNDIINAGFYVPDREVNPLLKEIVVK